MRFAATEIVAQAAFYGSLLIQGNPILPGMSLAYENLSSVGMPRSIVALANDYLASGHREARIVTPIS